MFSRLANFFIQNSKLTFIIVLVTLLSGTVSYVLIPKQYNPTIIVPAFFVQIPSLGLSSEENKNLILNELEDKVTEIEWINKTYGVALDNAVGLMVQFKVGVDKEKAKIRILQKISENTPSSNIDAGKPIIQTIDPDELPQISYALSLRGKSSLNPAERLIYLRKIALIVKDHLRSVPWTTTLDIVGGRNWKYVTRHTSSIWKSQTK